MKKQFQSKAVPRGTRTIWRYFGALFILFTFAIGNVWAADQSGTVTFYKSGGKLTTTTIPNDNSNVTFTFSELSANSSSATICSTGSQYGIKGKNTTLITVTCPSGYYFKSAQFSLGSFGNSETPKAEIFSGSTRLYECSAHKYTKLDACGNIFSCEDSIANFASNKYTTLSVKETGNSKNLGVAKLVYTIAEIDGGGDEPGGDPVDPVFTYTPATYTIGDPALDLSTKLTSTNTTGAITFAIKDAASTGATIANSKNFTATTVGTAKVTVTQAASTGYNAKSQDIDVTVAAPDPCHKYFWFSKAADATTAGVTNNEGSFFTTSAPGSNSTTSSLTIDEVEYAITNRTGNIGADDATIVSFTIPANKAGVLYVNMASSGNKGESSSRTLYLKKGGDTIVTATNAIYGDGAQHNATIENIPSGTYTLHANNNVKVGMFAVKACDATYHTITLDLDGGTGATSIAALDGVPAYKPADPTKAHCAFAGWVVKSTSAAYDWDANVTGDLELKATWTQLYTVTFANGGGSGDAPAAVADKAQGETFTVPANTFTAPTNKEFDIWNDGSADYAPGVTYTVGTANVVLTAQWKTLQDKYTVIFKDGDVTLGTRQFDVASNPSDADIDKTKSLFTFAAWQKDAADIALDAAFWATVAKDAEITLTARWAKAYATSYDMEAYAASEGASKAGIEAALTAANYAYTNINDIDNGHTHNYIYDGMKYKTNDGDLSFNVNAGKVVEVKTGYLPSNDAVTMYINGVADATVFESAVEASETHKMNYFYSAAEALYRLDVKASKGTCAVKKVTIRDPYTVSYNPHGADAIDAQNATPSVTLPTPANGTGNFKGWYDAETEGNKIGNAGASYTPTANITLHAQWETVSSDNTLSDLQVDGATVAGFDPAVQIYNLVYEYGKQPVITSATATAGALATVTINNTPVEEATFKYVQVKVEAESGAERFYQVRYTNNPKQGATIFKAELTSNTAADYSGMYADGDNSEIKLADDGANGYKFASKSNYIKMAITDATFAEGDMLKMTYTTNPQQGELAIYDGTTKLQGTAYSNHILTFSDVADGKSTLFIRRTDDNNFNGWVAQVEVQRYMAPIIKSYKIGAVSGTIDQEHKTIAIELPYGTSLYGVAATIEAYANGGATVIAPTPLAYDTPLGYKVSSAYVEDGDVDYTVTITEAEHYEAMIVGGESYTTLAAAVAAAQADDVVKLLDNVDLMATGLTIAENITLDLNDFNIKAGEQIDNDIVVPAGKKLTLVDNSANAEGKIYTEQAYTGAVTGYGLIRVAGELLMQSGNIYAVIESDPANLGQFAVVLGAGGKATIEGGQIKAGWYAISNNGNNTGSTIIVSGGELISTADFAIYNPAKESTVTVSGGVVYGAAGGIAMNRGELTVTGGTITSKDQGTTGTWGDGTGGLSNAAIAASGKYESVEVEISGGTIIAEGTAVMITNGTTNPVEIAISGGQFSHVVPAEYCAEGFAPVTTPNAQGKYEVIAAGVIRGAAVQDAEDVYYYTLDNGVTIYSSQSDGRLNTSNHIATSGDIEPCGGDHGGYNVNQSKFVLKFPVNVKEFTLYGANSTERSISKVYDNAEASKDIKISTVGRELTGTYTNTKDGKCQTLTAAFNDENIIPANYYVLVTLSGTANIYRVLYTEAECTTPTVTIADQTAKDGVAVTLTAEASALGATYQWYTCDDAQGTNPVIIPSETAKTLSVTKSGADDQFYKVVVGCNCSAETAEDVAKVSLYTEVTTLVDVTENTVWDWSTIVNDVDGAAITSDGKKVNGANGILANYIQGTNMDKVESNNGAYAIRSNSNQYYQGASLHMHTTKGGILKIHARSDGNTMTLNVQNAGRDIEIGSLGNWKDYTIYVQAGDVVIYNVPETAGKPMRIDQMTFTVKETPDYTRNVSSNYGTLCVEHNVLVGGAPGATFYQIASRNEDYDYKIDFEEVLPNEELKAGEPYLFKSNTGKIELFYGETEAPEPVAVRGMIGNYDPSQLAITEENKNTIYYFAQNKLWLCDNLVGSNLILNEHRAYIDLTQVPTYAEYEASKQQQQNSAPRRRVSLEMNGEKIATGCENLNVSDKPVKMIINGQFFILRGEKMYDAKGQLVK